MTARTMTSRTATAHLGTFRAAAYRHASEPTYSLTHALVSGATMAGFMVVALFWIGGL